MIRLHLNHSPQLHEGVYLQFPATQNEIEDAFGLLHELGEGTIIIFGVDAPIQNLGNYIRNVDVREESNLNRLQELAQIIEGMTEEECNIFSGALDAESLNGLDDVLKLSKRLGDYIILPNVKTDTELGRILVGAGYKNFPESVQPYLDYRAIGAEYYAENGGAYGPGGYVRRKTAQEQSRTQRDTLIVLHLATTQTECRLLLPAEDTELELAKNQLNVCDFAQARIVKAECNIPYIGEMICQLNCPSVESYDLLADTLKNLQQKNGALLTYAAVLEVEQPETVEKAWELAWNLDDYERITERAYEYGQSVLRRCGADEEIINAIDGYMDFEKFGKDAMVEDGVRQTEFGLLRRCSDPFPTEEQNQQMCGP